MFLKPPIALGIVINVQDKFLKPLKRQLVEAVKDLDLDERICLYDVNVEEFFKSVGKAVAGITTYTHKDNFDLTIAVKQLIYFMVQEIHLEPYIFVFMDKFKEKDYFNIENALLLENRTFSRSKIIVVFLDEQELNWVKKLKDRFEFFDFITPEMNLVAKEMKDIWQRNP